MSECSLTRENMPLLLTESLDQVRRELTHQHIETCEACGDEWRGYNDTWRLLGDMPELDVPRRVKDAFLSQVAPAVLAAPNVVPFHRRKPVRWLAQAAAIAVFVGGGFYAGRREPVRLEPSPAALMTAQQVSSAPYAIAETRVLQARSLSPNIEGRPAIENVQFIDDDPTDNKIGVSFDVTSKVTVTGAPTDRSMVRLLSYVLQNQDTMTPSRGRTIDWVRQTYSNPAYADPEIASALANVLRNDTHEGVRIQAVDTLTNLPATNAPEPREALVEALKNDPNPAVRLKAVEALAQITARGEAVDASIVDTLRQKASDDDENLYVRVKAAEALSKVRP